jgi:hypothetical protein
MIMLRLLSSISLAALLCAGAVCGGRSAPAGHSGAWDPFLDSLQQRTLRWFIVASPERTGLTPDRWPSSAPASIGAAGFGLTAIPLAAERKIISRVQAATRVLTSLRFLLAIPQGNAGAGVGGFRGFFYHFVNAHTGIREWNSELSTVDTGLLMMGVLFCQSYFVGPGRREREIRRLADSLYRRVDWTWAMNGTEGITLGWTPEEGFHRMTWRGYNEALFLYIIALGSPTHPVPVAAYAHWLSNYRWYSFQGREFVSFAPLFGHQYSACWIDFRGIRDAYMQQKGIDYFENSRRATYAQREYGKANPGGWRDYTGVIWGWTACDGPGDTTLTVDGMRRKFQGYAARGPSADWTNDDGTLAPTAVAGSLPFAPEICIPALKGMRERYGDRLYSDFGFRDAFNPSFITAPTPEGWYDKEYLGIDQGPIALMIGNLRSGLVWRLMRTNPYIVAGLRRAGFAGGWLDAH